MYIVSEMAFLPGKYPQIKKLFGYDPMFKWIVTGMVLIQFISIFFVKDLSYPMLFLVAYCFGGVINHSLMLGTYKLFHCETHSNNSVSYDYYRDSLGKEASHTCPRNYFTQTFIRVS